MSVNTATIKTEFLRNEMRQEKEMSVERERETVTLRSEEESIWKIQEFVVSMFQGFLLIRNKNPKEEDEHNIC